MNYASPLGAYDKQMGEMKQLRKIVDAAWAVRREESDHNPCPDLGLRASARRHLYKLLDERKRGQP